MDLEIAKKIIKQIVTNSQQDIARSMTAERYYRNDNDILHMPAPEDENGNPLRNSDNRIPRNFYGLLVNQKASYMFTSPPLFDFGDFDTNRLVADTLGNRWAKVCKRLCINASNCGKAWLHYWMSEDNTLKYAVVDSKQIAPVWSDDLEEELVAILRSYYKLDEDTGEEYIIYEYWTSQQVETYRRRADRTMEDLQFYNCYCVGDGEYVSTLTHGFGRVPFICFNNNDMGTRDLDNVKALIDTYDKVFSGFVNDLEDVQELIFVLAGYEGTNLQEFLTNIKKYKAIKVDASEGGAVSTLAIDIPVEAREKLLEMTRKAIFEQGQGVDPQPEQFGNSSGVALKYLYSLLELKAGLCETEFRISCDEFVRVICDYLGIEADTITQTWTRTAITNELEQAQICQASVGIISDLSIRKAHPLVDDIAQEQEQIKIEEQEKMDKMKQEAEMYDNNSFGGGSDEE